MHDTWSAFSLVFRSLSRNHCLSSLHCCLYRVLLLIFKSKEPETVRMSCDLSTKEWPENFFGGNSEVVFVLKITEWKYAPCAWAITTFEGMLSHFIEILFIGYENDMTLYPPLDSPNFNLPETIFHPQCKHEQEMLHRDQFPTEEQTAPASNTYPWHHTFLPNIRCFSCAFSNVSAVALKETLTLVACLSDSWWQQKRPSLFNVSLDKQ